MKRCGILIIITLSSFFFLSILITLRALTTPNSIKHNICTSAVSTREGLQSDHKVTPLESRLRRHWPSALLISILKENLRAPNENEGQLTSKTVVMICVKSSLAKQICFRNMGETFDARETSAINI